MRYKNLWYSCCLMLFAFSFVSCDSDKDNEVDFDSSILGKWEFAIPVDEWSITYEFKSGNVLKVTEREEYWTGKAEGKWSLEDGELELLIYWGGDYDYPDKYMFSIISRTSKTMTVYSYDDREEQIWKKK